ERPDARREWMELVREFVPADEREPVWKSVADRLVAGESTDEVTKFLADTGPHPDERRAIAEAAVSRLMNRYTGAGIKPVTLESAGDWRQWLAETLPEGSEESL